ncbi:MAG: DNA-binding response regulator [Rhodocyclales bacterium GT-UBC]|nr:MAG: DNA-binding response regulator [Rhodocyclales bacterium GT-UBC]
MQHWILDTQSNPLTNWLEAFPTAVLIKSAADIAATGESGIIWCRAGAADASLAEVVGSGFPVVLMSDEPDEQLTLLALSMGASGCCNSRAAPEVLSQIALVVGNGGLWVGQSLLQKLVAGSGRVLAARPAQGGADALLSQLSERELQVARLVAAGESNKEIAGRLDISERTVKAHLTAIFAKLGLRDRLQLSVTVNGISLAGNS